jgi:hypothetical protein
MHPKNNDDKKCLYIFQKVILKSLLSKTEVVIFNSFDINARRFYYILFTAEQLNLNPENFPLELIGNIDTESDYFKIAYKYIP